MHMRHSQYYFVSQVSHKFQTTCMLVISRMRVKKTTVAASLVSSLVLSAKCWEREIDRKTIVVNNYYDSRGLS